MNQAASYMNELIALARQTVAESCVLLKNEHSALPLEHGARIAVFGTAQLHYYPSGLGSGGLVNTRGMTNLCEALSESGLCTLNGTVQNAYRSWNETHPFVTGDGWAGHPWTQEQMPLTDALLTAAAEESDAAVIILGRTAGEDKDNADVPGSWLLTADEETMLRQVRAHFGRVIVLLNVGNIMDMAWVDTLDPDAVMYVWQGGQEGARGTVDVLFGHAAPSGRLTDTIPLSLADMPSSRNFGDHERNFYEEDIYVGYRYFETFAPDKVLFPFGAGLSYTTFDHQPLEISCDKTGVTLRHQVRNTGSTAAREVVQVYVQQPQGKLGKPARVLCGFEKTELLQPGESVEVKVRIAWRELASYDDGGVTGHRSCWMLEGGDYRFFSGHDVRQALDAGSIALQEQVLEQLEEACAPILPFRRVRPDQNGSLTMEDVPLATHGVNALRRERLPEELPQTGDRGIRLADVAAGQASMEAFAAQLSDEDLCCIVRGEGMSSSRVTPGTAGAIGGVSDRLTALGIPAICCTDGPSGIRMDCGNIAFYLPSGTAQACTWNKALIRQLYAREALDMRKNRIDMLLAPGMNLHRHPLNGRNFEYFSEDPLVTGRMAAAQLQGLHTYGVTGVVKHFACNSQETMRRRVEAVVSERALRELYLRGFEISVREGTARAVMTSYNPLNGVWTASSYDLVTTILRGQWGFTGIVMTDWWAFGSNDDLISSPTYVASMIRAQNDLFMVANCPSANSGNDDSAEALAEGKVTRGEYQRCAMNICRAVIETPTFQRFLGRETQLDRDLEAQRQQEGDVMLDVDEVSVDENARVPGSRVPLTAGRTTLFQVRLSKRGIYAIRFRYRVSEAVTGVTQVSFSASQDQHVLGTVTHTGEDQGWRTVEYHTGRILRRLMFYLRVFSATGGVEIDHLEIERIEALE